MTDVTKEKKQRPLLQNSMRHPASTVLGENSRKRPARPTHSYGVNEQDLAAVEVDVGSGEPRTSRRRYEGMGSLTQKTTSETQGSCEATPVHSQNAKLSDASEQADNSGDSVSVEIPVEMDSQTDMLDDGEYPILDQSSDTQEFVVRISQSLRRKVSRQAHDEGLTTEEFVAELIAEGVVVRAWEIVERKNQMRGGSPNTQPPSRGNNSSSNNSNSNNSNNSSSNQYGRNQNNRKPNHRGGMSHTRYQSIMDDKATFLEYVRQQERNRR